MGTFISLQDTYDDFEVQFEVIQAVDEPKILDERQKKINEGLSSVEELIAENKKIIDELNVDIDRLTNHADGLDYTIAVACGVLTGLIDSFLVGGFEFNAAKAKSNKQVNEFIMKYAKRKGFEGDHLKDAITFLEKKYPVSQDNIWSGKKIGVSAKSHHLDDLAHHPTLLGLAAAVAVQFFRVGMFVNKDGEWHFEFSETDPKKLLKIWLPVIISGLLHWMIYMVESKNEDKLSDEIPEPVKKLVKLLASAPVAIELLAVAKNWIGHLVSDMGGSKNTAGGGMGIPGLFLSLLKEMSMLPILKDTELPKIVNDLYVKQKFDMRTELAVINELGRQAVPVIIGEVLVRGFYFVRHLVEEIKEHKNLKDVNWRNVVPFGNRTVARMLTISSGTFMAVDMADAAIRSAKNPTSVSLETFLANMVLRVNFVGVGKFAIAVGTDVGMGVKRGKLRNERMKLHEEQIMLLGAKMFYKEADMWIAAENAGKTIEKAYGMMETTTEFYIRSMSEMADNLNKISRYVPEIERKNPGLLADINEILAWE